MSRVECVDSHFIHIPLSTGWRAFHTDSFLGPTSSVGTCTDIVPLRYPCPTAKPIHNLIDKVSYQAYAAGSAGVATLLCKDSTVASEISASHNSTSALGFEVDAHQDYRGECLAMCEGLGILAAATGSFVSFFSMGSRLGASPFRNLEGYMSTNTRQQTHGSTPERGHIGASNVGAIKWAPLPVLARLSGASTSTDLGHLTPLYLCAYVAGGVVEVVACCRHASVASSSSSLPFSSVPSPQELASDQSLHFVRAPQEGDGKEYANDCVVLSMSQDNALKVVLSPNNALSPKEFAIASSNDITIATLDRVEEHQIGGPLVSTKKYVSKFKRTGIQDLFLEDSGVLQDVHWLSERHLLVVTASTVAVVDIWGRMQEAIRYPNALTPDAITAAAERQAAKKKAATAKMGAKRERQEGDNAGDADAATIESISASRRSVLLDGTIYTSLQHDERVATFYHSSSEMFKSRFLEDRFGLKEDSWIDKKGRYVIPEFAPSVNGSGVSECSLMDLPEVARPGAAAPTSRSWIVAVGGVSTHIRAPDLEPVTELTSSPVRDLLSPGIVFLAITLTDTATTSSSAPDATFGCVPIGQWNGTSRSVGKGFTMDYFAPTALSMRARTSSCVSSTTNDTSSSLPPTQPSRCFQIVMCGTTLLSKDIGTKKLSRTHQIHPTASTAAMRQTEHKIPTRGADQRVGGYTWVLSMTPWSGQARGKKNTPPPYTFKGPRSDTLTSVRPVGQWVDVTPYVQWPATCLDVHTSHTSDDLASISIYKQDPCVRSIQCLSEITGIYSKLTSTDFHATAAIGFLIGGKNVVSFVTCPHNNSASPEATTTCARPWGVVVETAHFTSIEVSEGDTVPRSTTSEYRSLDGFGCGASSTTYQNIPTTLPLFSPMNQWYSDYDVNRFASMASSATYFTLDDMAWEANQRRVSKRGIGSTTNIQNDQCGKRRPLSAIEGILLSPTYYPSSEGGDSGSGVLGFDVAALLQYDDDIRVSGTWFSHNDRTSKSETNSSSGPASRLSTLIGGTLPPVSFAVSNVATASSLARHRRTQQGLHAPPPPNINNNAPSSNVLLPSLLPCANAMSDLLQAFKTVFFGAVSTTVLHALHHQNVGVTAVPSDLLLATCVPVSSSSSGIPAQLVENLSGAHLRIKRRSPTPCSHIPTLCLMSPMTTLIDLSLDASFPKVELARAIYNEQLEVTSLSRGHLNMASEMVRGFMDPSGQLRRLGEHASENGRFVGSIDQYYLSIICELQVLQEVYLRNPLITRSGETMGLEIQPSVASSPSAVGCGKESHGLNLYRKYPSPTVASAFMEVIDVSSAAPGGSTDSASPSGEVNPLLPVWEVALQRALSLTYQLPTDAIPHTTTTSPKWASLTDRSSIVRELLLGRAVGVLDRLCVAVETNVSEIARRPTRPMVTGDSCVGFIMACHNAISTTSSSPSAGSWAGVSSVPTMGATMPGVTTTSTTPSIVSRWERAKKSITPVAGMSYQGVSICLGASSAQHPSQISIEIAQAGDRGKTRYLLNAFFEPGPFKKGGMTRGMWGRRCGQCAQVTPMAGAQIGGVSPSPYHDGNAVCSLCRYEYTDESEFCLS